MPDEDTAAQPTRAKLIAWLRLNLGLMLFISGTLTGAGGMLIRTTLVFEDAKHNIDHLSFEVDGDKEHRGLEGDMIDVDRRFNDAAATVAELRRSRDLQMAAMQQHCDADNADALSRIKVLEAQMQFLADRVPLPAPPIGPQH